MNNSRPCPAATALAAVLLATSIVLPNVSARADTVDGLVEFSAGTPARAREVNGNFSEVADSVNDNDVRIAALEAEIAELREQLGNVMSVNQFLSLEMVNDRPAIRITGANLQIVNGEGKTASSNGTGNLLIGYNERRDEVVTSPQCSLGTIPNTGLGVSGETDCLAAGGEWAVNHTGGSHYLVVGSEHNYSRWGGIVVGLRNTSNYDFASVSGGVNNRASGSSSSVSGGSFNRAISKSSSISGGSANLTVIGPGSSVSGGYRNVAGRLYSSVSGGTDNDASGPYSSVSGGRDSLASGQYSSVSGGDDNVASGFYSSVSGGVDNTASGTNSSISGGRSNTASRPFASVSGGWSNTASGPSSSISGGYGNTASGGRASSVSGGQNRSAAGDYDWAAGSLSEDQ